MKKQSESTQDHKHSTQPEFTNPKKQSFPSFFVTRRKLLKFSLLLSFAEFLQNLFSWKAQAGGFVPFAFINKAIPLPSTYVDDVFSTYIYKANGSNQTVSNGIDLLTKSGLIWVKSRNSSASHYLIDTVRGGDSWLSSAGLAVANPGTGNNVKVSFSATGWSADTSTGANFTTNTVNFVSWTFQKANKFFDIVRYSGNGSTQSISHSLGTSPGMILIKRLDSASTKGWMVWHNGISSGNYMVLNSTAVQTTTSAVNIFGNNSATVDPTTSQFTVGSHADVNASGTNNYIAYLFANDQGTNSLIKCGSYVGDGTTNGTRFINLGFEPQFILLKNSTNDPSTSGPWQLFDHIRGLNNGYNDPSLAANVDGTEDTTNNMFTVSPGGFTHTYPGTAWNYSGSSYIYMAIRRPNKPPTAGTQVFSATTYNQTSPSPSVFGTVTPDLVIRLLRTGGNSYFAQEFDRLRGGGVGLVIPSNAAEGAGTSYFDGMFGHNQGSGGSGESACNLHFKRAPGFFDIICYTGNGATSNSIAHSLTVAPELMIVKKRTPAGGNWVFYHKYLTATQFMNVNEALMAYSFQHWANTEPTNTNFSVGYSGANYLNVNGDTYLTYLFATKAGVSKVGNYTGSASGAVTVPCGFTGAARFVLIKRTDATGDWIVVDYARGTGYYITLNNNAADQASSVVTFTTGGFTTAAPGSITNISGASYVFLAIS